MTNEYPSERPQPASAQAWEQMSGSQCLDAIGRGLTGSAYERQSKSEFEFLTSLEELLRQSTSELRQQERKAEDLPPYLLSQLSKAARSRLSSERKSLVMASLAEFLPGMESVEHENLLEDIYRLGWRVRTEQNRIYQDKKVYRAVFNSLQPDDLGRLHLPAEESAECKERANELLNEQIGTIEAYINWVIATFDHYSIINPKKADLFQNYRKHWYEAAIRFFPPSKELLMKDLQSKGQVRSPRVDTLSTPEFMPDRRGNRDAATQVREDLPGTEFKLHGGNFEIYFSLDGIAPTAAEQLPLKILLDIAQRGTLRAPALALLDKLPRVLRTTISAKTDIDELSKIQEMIMRHISAARTSRRSQE